MLVRHFKNHSPTPPKYVRLKLPTFANGGGEQLVPLEIVGERAQLLATFARVERTPGLYSASHSVSMRFTYNNKELNVKQVGLQYSFEFKFSSSSLDVLWERVPESR